MSVEALSWALNVPGLTAAQRLVLVGIANHDGDGGAWPAVATLARYACCTPRHVQRTVRELVALGLITVHTNEGGTDRVREDRRPNLYVIHRRGDTQVTRRSRGDICDTHGVTPMSPEPSKNHPVENSLTGSTEPCQHRWISALTGECPTCDTRQPVKHDV